MRKEDFFIGEREVRKVSETEASIEAGGDQALKSNPPDRPRDGTWETAFENRFGQPFPEGWTPQQAAEAVTYRNSVGAT